MSRILFVMPEPGYLRMYATTLLALAGRGHEVLLAYDRPPKSDRDTDALATAPPNLRFLSPVPEHGGAWRQPLTELGVTIDYIRFLSRREGTPYLRGRMDRYLPARFHGLKRAGSWPHGVVSGLFKASRLVERAVPADPALIRFLDELALNALVVSPLVLRGPGGAQQTQLVKAARSLGSPGGAWRSAAGTICRRRVSSACAPTPCWCGTRSSAARPLTCTTCRPIGSSSPARRRSTCGSSGSPCSTARPFVPGSACRATGG